MGLAEKIRVRRLGLDLSQTELAKKAGVSQQLINALENGKIGSTKFIPEIAAALGCSVEDLVPRFAVAGGNHQTASGAKRYAASNSLPILAAREVPGAEVSIQVSSDPVDYMERPSWLLNVRDSYGMYVADESMFPELEPGDIVFVNPHYPPLAGTTCFVFREAEGTKIGMIRRLIEFTSEEWLVKMWNNPRDHAAESALNRSVWRDCHRIVARSYRR